MTNETEADLAGLSITEGFRRLSEAIEQVFPTLTQASEALTCWRLRLETVPPETWAAVHLLEMEDDYFAQFRGDEEEEENMSRTTR